MKEHFSSRVTKLLVILALAIVASVMFVFVGCGEQHVHTWTQTKEQAATCTADGFIEYTCEECGDVRQDPVQATGHQWKDNGALQTHPATCTESGYYYKLCTVCNYEETSDRIPATGHTIDFNAATTDVTLPTCTTAGSISGVCTECGETVTYTSAQIAADKDADGLNITIANQPKDNVKVGTQETLYYPIVNGVKGDFLGVLGHDYLKNNTHTCVATIANDDKDVFGEDAADEATEYYYDYCTRCKTAFEVTEHEVPAGKLPCAVAKDPVSGKDLVAGACTAAINTGEYAAEGGSYAYQCEECKNYIAKVDHNYQLMSLKSGTANEDDAVWEAAPADAEFSCLYYEVCEWCHTARISAPHKANMAKPTCTEDVVCEVCKKVMASATDHDFDLATTVAPEGFGDFDKDELIVHATCVAPAKTYEVCKNCLEREQNGQDVEWVLNENYKEAIYTGENEGKPWGHSYKEGVVVYDNSVAAVGCARPYWYTDVCQREGCTEETTGHVRVELKPTAYTKSGSGENVVYTPVTDSTLKTDGTLYYIKNADGDYDLVDVSLYNANKKDADTYYTDENGYYNRQSGGTHDWGYVFAIDVNNVPINDTDKNSGNVASIVDYERNASLKDKGFVMPTCNTAGKVLRYCPNCDSYEWNDISLQAYLDGMNVAADAYGTAADQKFYPAYENETVGETVITGGKYLQKYHEENLFGCGHGECVVCETRSHEVQYSVSFKVTLAKGDYQGVTAPTISTFYGWTCKNDGVEKKALDEFVAKYLKGDDKFTYELSLNGTPITATNNKIWVAVGDPTLSPDAYSSKITVDVVAKPVEQYTIVFNTDGVRDEIKALAGFDKAFEKRIVYKAQSDKSQVMPTVEGAPNFTFYTDAAKQNKLNLKDFDWDKDVASLLVEGVFTIYVG